MRILNSTCKNHVNTTVHQNFDRKKISFNLFSCEPPAAARVDSRPLYRWRRSRAEVSWGELSHGESLEPFSSNLRAVTFSIPAILQWKLCSCCLRHSGEFFGYH